MVDLPIRREVLDHGFVELLDLMPRSGYLVTAVAEAARVSYGEGTKSFREDLGLFQYLLYHKHWSPFDQVKFKFRVRCPLFVRAQWYRHWSWDYNEESARYSEVREEYYIPEVLRGQDTRNKQGSRGTITNDEILEEWGTTMATSHARYRQALEDGVAREQARVVLPQAMYTTFIGTCSLRDLLVFLKQRLDKHAQWEIRRYAHVLEEILLDVDPTMLNICRNLFIDSVELSRDQWNLVKRAVMAYSPTGAGVNTPGYGAMTVVEKRGLDELLGK